MTAAVELYEFAPGHGFGETVTRREVFRGPGGRIAVLEREALGCNCGWCVVGAYWQVTHCGCCGKPNTPHAWDNVCDDCEGEL